MATKRALIVGVNKYPKLDDKYQLSGCVNDAELIKNVLCNYFDFSEDKVTQLYDDSATRDNVLKEMDRLVELTQASDVVVFHFSGHGSRRRSPDPGEGSGKDPTIMPHDSGRDPHPNRDITNLEINDWLSRLAEKTNNISLTFDCCHSGTVTRDPFSATIRAVPDDTRSAGEMGISQSDSSNVGAAAPRSTGAGGWLSLNDAYVVMSGCRNDEFSYEFTQEDGGETIRNGALTHFLTNALVKAGPGTTYRDVFEIAHQGVNGRFPKQNPQIEGAMDREIFGTRNIEPLHFIPVSGVESGIVTLDGGAAHGVNAGSRWEVYPPGTKVTKDLAASGVVEIISVGALTSEAKLVSGGAEARARCVESQPSPKQFLYKVDLSALDNETQGDLATGIAESDLLAQATTPQAANARVYLLQPRTEAGENDAVPQAGAISVASWAVVNNEGELTMPVHAASEDGVIDRLITNLETNARYQNALMLDNPGSNLNVEFNLYAQNDEGEWVNANGGGHAFTVGDRVGFEVVNNEKEPVFVSVLDFGLDGTIDLLYPRKTSSELIEPGRTLKVAMGNRKMRAGLPENYSHNHGRGALKAFITSEESDFRWLQQEGTRFIGVAKSRLQAQFEAAYNGPKTRKMGFDEEYDDEDWKATSRSFEIRR